MASFTHDIAISAVAYDAVVVEEVAAAIASRAAIGIANDDLSRRSSRLLLVLHQRLWSHDESTRADVAAVRTRLARDARSVCVVTLDDTPVDAWLADATRYALAEGGTAGAAAFVLSSLERCRGPRRTPASVLRVVPMTANGGPEDDEAPPENWTTRSAPGFLEQSRAISPLRRELTALETALESHVAALAARGEPDAATRAKPAESVHISPNRLVAQLGDVGLSFSWIMQAGDSVAAGRLLVIEWKGIVSHARAMGAARTAVACREQVYRADAVDASSWHWRTDDRAGAAYSSADLVGNWISGARHSATQSADRA